MKLASMANEAGFNRQRSLLRWASKLYSGSVEKYWGCFFVSWYFVSLHYEHT